MTYTRFFQRFPGLAQAYCLTFVKNVAPEEVLHRLDAGDRASYRGIDELLEPSYDVYDRYNGDRLFVGVTQLGAWSLAVEPNGYLGDTKGGALSRGTTLVSHFHNVNAVGRVTLLEDGQPRLSFDPQFPTRRYGSDRDGLLDVMREVGFDLGDGAPVPPDEAAFGLVAYLTGVDLDPDALARATFRAGTAPV